MNIVRADKKHIEGINKLLYQVLMVHHNGRPDIFKPNCKKYTDDELIDLLSDDSRPIFVALDEDNEVLGYAFCILEDHSSDNVLTPIKTMYIDDLCVDENKRGTHVGRHLYEYVKDYSKSIGCYNVTLNVWECNPEAKGFYEHLGLKPLKYGMEYIL